MKLYSKDMQAKHPTTLSKHASDGDVEKAIEDYIDKGKPDYSTSVGLIRWLHWQYKLHEEKARLLSEDLCHYAEYNNAIKRGDDEFGAIKSIVENRILNRLRNNFYYARNRGGEPRECIPYHEIMSIISATIL